MRMITNYANKKISESWFLKEFSKTLKLPKRKPGKPVILAVAGPSCVGKTTAMKFIQKKLPYFARISHDEMRLFIYRRGFPDSPKVESFIYDNAPSYVLAEKYLKLGYSVILDDNLVSKPVKIKSVRNLARKFRIKFFVFSVLATEDFIKKKLKEKIKARNFLKTGVFRDWRVGLEHFRRSKGFDYDKFDKLYLAKINSAKPLNRQLKEAIGTLKEEMEVK